MGGGGEGEGGEIGLMPMSGDPCCINGGNLHPCCSRIHCRSCRDGSGIESMDASDWSDHRRVRDWYRGHGRPNVHC